MGIQIFQWLMFQGISTVVQILGYKLPVFFMGHGLVFLVLYVWCMRNPFAQASFFGFQFKAAYLPWVLAGVQLLFGQIPASELIGIAAGHVYHFFKSLWPAQHGNQELWFMKTPSWMYRLFPNTNAPVNVQAGFTFQAPQQAQQQRPAGPRAFQGRGHVLGGR